MKFALLDTKNNASLISALSQECHVISPSGKASAIDIDAETLESINEIIERNVKRRQIRFPKIFGNVVIAAIYRKLFHYRAINSYRYFRLILAGLDDTIALIFNGYLAPNALFDLAASDVGMRKLYIENGFFPKTLQADIAGINALSTLPRDAAFYDNLSLSDVGTGWPTELVVRQSKLRDGNTPNLERKLPEKYIFVPFQVPSDMQILALSPWIKDMVHLYNEIYALAEAFPKQHFVIKEHPSFPLSIRKQIKQHQNVHFANSSATRDLILGSEAVLTINSTVGLEAVTLGKKVITLGDAHYAIDGITLQASNTGELHNQMHSLLKWKPDEERREKFIKFVFNLFLLPINREHAGSDCTKLLEQRAMGRDMYSRLLLGKEE